MRGSGLRLTAMLLSALAPVACLSLSEVEPNADDASLGGSAGVGGVPNDVWQIESAVGGSAGSDASLPVAFPARGVRFDGVEDWLELAGPFSGVADSKRVTASVWFKRHGTGSQYCIGPEASGAEDRDQMEWMATDQFRVSWRRAGGGTACDLHSEKAITNSAWHHIAFSIDANDVTKTRLYVDGDLDLAPGYSVSGDDLDHTGSQWGLFARNNGALKYDGEVAELWLDLDTYLDLSDPATLARFRTSDGKPADLGVDGALPTGKPPTVYLSIRDADAPAFFATNRGLGGDFTLHGSLEASQTSPGD